MNEEPLILYTEAYWLSPWDCACWVALREKGLPFARSIAILPGGHLMEELRTHTVAARVPALQHGAFWLSDSQAIIEYLEDAFPRTPVLPRPPRERARARQVSLLARTGLPALRRERPAYMLFYPTSPPPLSAEARGEAEELLDVVARLGVGRGQWTFGDFSVTDADLAFALQRLRRTGHELSAELVAYIDRVWERPSVRDYVGHPRPPNPPVEDVNTRR